MVAQTRAVSVQVLDGGHVIRFERAPVHDQNVMARRHQLLDGHPADEPGSAENHDSHVSLMF